MPDSFARVRPIERCISSTVLYRTMRTQRRIYPLDVFETPLGGVCSRSRGTASSESPPLRHIRASARRSETKWTDERL